MNWFDILVEPRINQYFKAETVKYNTVDIAPNRETIRENVRAALARDLQNFSVTVEDLLIDNIDFNADFKRSIEEKQIAAQNALREGERIAQAQAEAVQNEERAKGEARAVEERAKGDAAAEIERARGNAEAILLRAEAQAQANVLLDESLTPQVIQYLAVDKLAPNIDIALIPSGQNIIIDPAALYRARASTMTSQRSQRFPPRQRARPRGISEGRAPGRLVAQGSTRKTQTESCAI